MNGSELWEVAAVDSLAPDEIRDFRAGDHAAFEKVVRAFYPRVYRLCLRLLGQAADAEDAAQEAFLRVHRAASRYRGNAALSTWIYRIAYNTCLDELRRQRKARQARFDDGDVLEATLAAIPDPGSGPEDIACTADELAVVRDILTELPFEYRAVLVLREIEQLSYDEIAAVLKCPVGTVRSRLARGRRLLAEKLRGRVHIDVREDQSAAASS